jgi:putative Holliday junction resolvase
MGGASSRRAACKAEPDVRPCLRTGARLRMGGASRAGLAASMSAVARVRRPQAFLAFDFSPRRVGVAVGNTMLKQAQPLTTLAAQGDARFAAIARLVQEWQPNALVVGVPTHPDGVPHDNTRRAKAFARQLHGRFKLPVHEVDERYTSVEAISLGADDVDAAAAALILEQYLRAQA